jgi:hypothetical protein
VPIDFYDDDPAAFADDDHYDDFGDYPGGASSAAGGGAASRRRAARRAASSDVSSSVRAAAEADWFAVAAAALCTGAEARRATQLVDQLRTAEVLFEALRYELAEACRDALAVVTATLGDLHAGEVWLGDLGLLSGRRIAPDVQAVLARIASTDPAEHPESRLAGAVASARKQMSRDGASKLISAIDSGDPPDELAKAYSSIAPPTALDDSSSAAGLVTVADLFAAGDGVRSTMSLSSGFRTLDLALTTRPEYDLGSFRQGQLSVLVAPSGSGKTSALNTIIPAMAHDATRQGHLGPLLFVHVEDETSDLFDSMGIAPGRRYSYLAGNVATAKTTDRAEFVKFFYRSILHAKHRSIETGLPESLFGPVAMVVDYYQPLTGDNDGNEVQTTSTNANLLLYGIANCDPVACRKYSGVSFEEYTGEAWPEGLTGHGVAVVATAQLLLKGNQKPYNPDKDDWRSYAIADGLDQPVWEPQPGDYPLARLDDIRGATTIIQHATTIIGLHRPRPRNNPEVGFTSDGFPTLADTRGYFTILKARYGQSMAVVPMEFNRQRNGGSKAQYIDAAAEAAMARTSMRWDGELFRASGDPIVPVRETRSRMRLVRYDA